MSKTGRGAGAGFAFALTLLFFLAAIVPGVSAAPIGKVRTASLLPSGTDLSSIPSGTTDLAPKGLLSRGKFLVAAKHMKDPRFWETVIVLLEYGPEGAFGLVVNRPTKLKLSSALPGIEALEGRLDPLYYGGPVNTNQIMMLVRSKEPVDGSRHVFGDVWASSSRDLLQRKLDDEATGRVLRVYAGYSGWAPRQLDREVSQGGWHVLKADAEAIFGEKHSEVWKRLMQVF